ncbi:TetR/AcrR family transcriptional regulator [Nocardia arthritidis]|uniref:TetR/AcrR family transcriptional regulator n=1 Tax=Nocardia arthritidis TaxID=228602 RepID=UPI001EEA6540|nr:TetR/AcrR family transcriptional regulator [Nocardia arthritidis]
MSSVLELIPFVVKEVMRVSMSRKERSAETEQALKAAARRLFAERGYLNTKITDITAAAGRAAGSFYNHFASKEQLLRELLNDVAADEDRHVETGEHNPDFTDPAAVRFHVEVFWRSSRKHWPVYRSVQQAALVDDEFARQAWQFGKQQRDDIIDHLDAFDERGLKLPARPDASLAMMFLLVTGLLQAVEDGAVEMSDEQAIDALTRFVYRGLTGRDC